MAYYSVNEIIEAYKRGFEDGLKNNFSQLPAYPPQPQKDNTGDYCDKYKSWNYC